MRTRTGSMLAVAARVSGAVVLAGCGGGAEAPTGYANYNAKNGAFACDYPENWESDGGGKSNHWAKFTSGSALVRIKTDITGSLMGDIAQSQNQSAGIDGAYTALAFDGADPVIAYQATFADPITQETVRELRVARGVRR